MEQLVSNYGGAPVMKLGGRRQHSISRDHESDDVFLIFYAKPKRLMLFIVTHDHIIDKKSDLQVFQHGCNRSKGDWAMVISLC